jgi:hypothetical protein
VRSRKEILDAVESPNDKQLEVLLDIRDILASKEKCACLEPKLSRKEKSK